jgi:hypothetical protein
MFSLIFVSNQTDSPQKTTIMDKLEKLALMDKILRELDDLKNSQTSVLKKLSQIEANNINLGATLLEKKLPDLHEEVDSGVSIITGLLDEFQQYRNKFYADNKLGDLQNPTA